MHPRLRRWQEADLSVSWLRSRPSGFVQVTLCLLTFGRRKLKWREQVNALIQVSAPLRISIWLVK